MHLQRVLVLIDTALHIREQTRLAEVGDGLARSAPCGRVCLRAGRTVQIQGDVSDGRLIGCELAEGDSGQVDMVARAKEHNALAGRVSAGAELETYILSTGTAA